MVRPEFPTFNKKPSPPLAWNGIVRCMIVLIALSPRAQRLVTLSWGARVGFNLD
jgi:hypothetical protein